MSLRLPPINSRYPRKTYFKTSSDSPSRTPYTKNFDLQTKYDTPGTPSSHGSQPSIRQIENSIHGTLEFLNGFDGDRKDVKKDDKFGRDVPGGRKSQAVDSAYKKMIDGDGEPVYVSLDQNRKIIWVFSFVIHTKNVGSKHSDHLYSMAHRSVHHFDRRNLTMQEQRLQKVRKGSTLVEKLREPEFSSKNAFKISRFPSLQPNLLDDSFDETQSDVLSARSSTTEATSVHSSRRSVKAGNGDDNLGDRQHYEHIKNHLLDEYALQFRDTLIQRSSGKKNDLTDREQKMIRHFGLVSTLKDHDWLRNVLFLDDDTTVVRCRLKSWADVINITKMFNSLEWDEMLLERSRNRDTLYCHSNQLAGVSQKAMNEAQLWKSLRTIRKTKKVNSLWGKPARKLEKRMTDFNRRKVFYDLMIERFSRERFMTEQLVWALYLLKLYMIEEWKISPRLFFHFTEQFGYSNFFSDGACTFFMERLRELTLTKPNDVRQYRRLLEEAKQEGSRHKLARYLNSVHHISEEALVEFRKKVEEIRVTFLHNVHQHGLTEAITML